MSKTRIFMAVPLAAAAVTMGAAPALAEPADMAALDMAEIIDPEDPGPQDVPDEKDGPNPDNDDDDPDEKDGPNPDNDDDDADDNDDGDNDDGDNDDGDNDDGDNDDGDNDDGDNDDGDNDDDGVKRPTRVDAGDPDGNGLSLAWVLAGGAVVSAAGSFVARKRLL